MQYDQVFIKKALSLARRGEGRVSPNPLVGAVIVKRGRIIAQGYHKRAGCPHAEIEALRAASVPVKGAVLYTNLEPCCTSGRTPPCTDAIIQSGITRVVVSMRDPNPRVNGRSLRILSKAGIRVDLGLCEDEARKVNEIFLVNMRHKRPFVALKLAESIDGKIATRAYVSKWVTCERARRAGRRLRDAYDAVLVGVTTVLRDNPSLAGARNDSYRVVVDPRLRIPDSCSLVRKNKERLIIFCSRGAYSKKKFVGLRKHGIRIYPLASRSHKLAPSEMLRCLYRLGICSVYIEGGGYTAGAFHDACLLDKTYFFIAPLIIGGKDAVPSVGARGVSTIRTAATLADVSVARQGKDILVIGYPRFA